MNNGLYVIEIRYLEMDFVKREDQPNTADEEQYKAYIESLQKSAAEMDYQHTPISMEQLHQAMQSSLQSSLNSSVIHNFQLPLSPRQMSTLMLKTNHFTRNDIPHLTRNLEMDIVQNLSNDISQRLGQELTQNLRQEDLRNVDISRMNDLELQNNITQHLLSEEMRMGNDLSHNLNRINDVLPQNLSMEIPQNLSNEIDLSHHLNRHEQEILQDEARRMVPLHDNLIDGRLEQNLTQQGLQRLVPSISIHEQRLDNDYPMPVPFIKSENDDDGYFHQDGVNGVNQSIFVNGLSGQLPAHTDHIAAQNVQENPMYLYNTNVNIPALNAIDLYARPQNYIQNYVARENPQNLVVNRFENQFKENGEEKIVREEPKENLKPTDQNKLFYEFSQNIYEEKMDPEAKLTISDDPTLIKGEYACYKCNEVFPSKRSLKQHSKVCTETGDGENSDKLGKYSCTQCPYRCQSPAILKIHDRTHSGEKPFACTFCDYKSGQKNNVAKHILVHMKEKPFRCQYCDYRCAQKNNLVVHERTHTGYKPFACPYCEYRTVQKPNLVKHMYLHTDQKPFSCDMCSYRCVQKTNLTKHKLRHLNEKEGDKFDVKTNFKPYRPRQKSVKCPHCTYRCVQKSSLEKHLQFKHAELPQTLPDTAENLEKNVPENEAETNFETQNVPENEAAEKNFETETCDETIQNLSVKKNDMPLDNVEAYRFTESHTVK